mmetsp:Transcript_827/g.2858  ORF Transcript_827/g.2858 Transcript_827/m.2858 type:complete len:294 (-) Transcript_827:692-1573(-)
MRKQRTLSVRVCIFFYPRRWRGGPQGKVPATKMDHSPASFGRPRVRLSTLGPATSLHVEHLELLVEGDGDPVGRLRAPRDGVERAAALVREAARAVGARRVGGVPNDRAAVLAGGAQVRRGVRRPGEGVQRPLVAAAEVSLAVRGVAEVKHDNLARLGGDRSEMVRVLPVPLDAEHRHRRLRVLVHDGAVVHAADVEDADVAVSAARGEDVRRLGLERDVEHLLVVRDEVDRDVLRVQVPQGHGRVDGRSGDELGVVGVPVEARDGGAEVLADVGARRVLKRVRERRRHGHLG